MNDLPLIIVSLSLMNVLLLAGLTLLTLTLSNRHALNRQLALALLAFLVTNGLLLMQIFSSGSSNPEVVTRIFQALNIIVFGGVWMVFRVLQTLTGARQWTRNATRILGIAGVLLSIAIVLFGHSATDLGHASLSRPLGAASSVYILCVFGCGALLTWQTRRQHLSWLFVAGLGLLLLAFIPVLWGGWTLFSASVILRSAGCIALIFGALRVRQINGFESERSRLAIVRAAGVSLTTRLELDALLDLIARQAAGLAGSPASVLYLFDGSLLISAATFGLNNDPQLPQTVKLGGGLAGRAAALRQAQSVPDYQQWSGRTSQVDAAYSIFAAAAIPLIFSEEIVGVLTVFEFTPERTYTTEDIAGLELLAPQAAIAIVNARAYAQLAQREQRMSKQRDQLWRVNDAVANMLQTPDPLARLQIVANTAAKLGWGQATLALFDATRQVIKQIDAEMPADLTRLRDTKPTLKGTEIDQAVVWASQLQAMSAAPRIGVGYILQANPPASPKSASSEPFAWEADDTLLIPLTLSDGTLAGMIRLKAPNDALRPDEESLRPLAILAAQAAATLENNHLLEDLRAAKTLLTEQVDELTMMQRVDQELGATLNFENVLTLTTDWAVRRTGARTGTLGIVTPDGTGLILLALLGYPPSAKIYNASNPLPLSMGVIGRAVRTRQMYLVRDPAADPDFMEVLPGIRTQIAVPMEMQGRVLGVLSLESDRPDAFDASDVAFIKRLATRAAVALDNARLYDEAERRADEMAILYTAGRAISSSLERDQIMPQVAQSIATMLNVSSTLIGDCRLDRMTANVLYTYRLGTLQNSSERLPNVGETWNLTKMSTFQKALMRQQSVSLRRSDPNLTDWEHTYLDSLNVKALLMSPLVVQNQVWGVAVAFESRRDREFTRDDILLSESLASQAAVAFRQAQLYDEVRELENLKSEMIRMASHDLRNPLGNVMGYLELMMMEIGSKLTPEQHEYVMNIRRSANSMKSLIDDLLTLEKVESERQSSWARVNLTQLVQDAYEMQLTAAALKTQELDLENDVAIMNAFGSATQLRQAITNLISNAIKYTPDAGQIVVRLRQIEDRFYFEVQDNGYGIAPDRQARLFQRFYRARQPGTDHIPGTGLGLSSGQNRD